MFGTMDNPVSISVPYAWAIIAFGRFVCPFSGVVVPARATCPYLPPYRTPVWTALGTAVAYEPGNAAAAPFSMGS